MIKYLLFTLILSSSLYAEEKITGNVEYSFLKGDDFGKSSSVGGELFYYQFSFLYEYQRLTDTEDSKTKSVTVGLAMDLPFYTNIGFDFARTEEPDDIFRQTWKIKASKSAMIISDLVSSFSFYYGQSSIEQENDPLFQITEALNRPNSVRPVIENFYSISLNQEIIYDLYIGVLYSKYKYDIDPLEATTFRITEAPFFNVRTYVYNFLDHSYSLFSAYYYKKLSITFSYGYDITVLNDVYTHSYDLIFDYNVFKKVTLGLNFGMTKEKSQDRSNTIGFSLSLDF